jgi:regulator of sirC expression with transglutaminase-like and TPR domain
MLTGLMRAIDQTGLKPSADAGRLDTLALARLEKTIYRDWGITFNPCDATIKAFLPQKVYGTKKGTCLGIALLFLLIAEKYGYPLHGVALPGHFFLRADPGPNALPRNIEPNAMGIERTDDYYRQRYGIAAGSWYYPLRNLSRKETGAVFFYMIGNICREKGKLREAELCYKTALRLFPDYPDALGNMAIVFSSQGKNDSALLLLDRAAVLNPVDRKIWRNKGMLLLENGREKAAVDLAVERLAVTPDDTGLLYVNALGIIKTGPYGDAAKAVRRFSEYGDTTRTKALERLLAKMKKS